MGILWSKTSSDDYERILSDLTTRIVELESLLADYRHRERRWSVWILSYGTLFYVLHAAYVFLYPRGQPTLAYRPLLDVAGLLIGPLVIYYGRRIVSWLYGRRMAGLEAALRNMRAKQKLKVEELKKLTSYYKTKGLVERFEIPDDEPVPVERVTGSVPNIVSPPVVDTISEKIQLRPFVPESTPTPPVPIPPMPIPTPQTWLDRLVDAIIGDDRNTRYALICPRCYAHNGLARPDEFDTIRTASLLSLIVVEYLCPNCHHMILPRVPKDPPGLPAASYSESSESIPEVSQATPKQQNKNVRRRGRRKSSVPDQSHSE
jgi:hypothetical protein